MSHQRKSRRRFLADLLFAGGVVSAAALLARQTGQSLQPPEPAVPGGIRPPQPHEDPIQLDGEVSCPQPQTTPKEPPREPGKNSSTPLPR